MKKIEQEQFDRMAADLDRIQKDNAVLREKCLRKEAQIARQKLCNDKTAALREGFQNMYYIDLHEAAMSIFEIEGLTPTPRNFFNSKLLERQILDFAPVVVFEYEYNFTDAKGNNTRKKCPLVLPFTPAQGIMDVYGGAPILQPFANGGNAENSYFPELVVGENCVVFSDFYEWSQTNANTSRTVASVIRACADMLADIEVTKLINRNWTKIPILIRPDEGADQNEVKKMLEDVQEIVMGIRTNAASVVTKYAKNIELLPVQSQYLGEELEKAKQDVFNFVYDFLGIGTIKNDKKERQIRAEVYDVSDQYNINITKRLQLREKSLEEAKKILPEWFPSTCKYKVNLAGYSTVSDE